MAGAWDALWLRRTSDPRLTTLLEFSADFLPWTIVPAAQAQSISSAGGMTLLRSRIPAAPGTSLFIRQRVSYISPE